MKLAAHEAGITLKLKWSAVVAAKQALEAYGSGHEYETTLQTQLVQMVQPSKFFNKNYINAAKAQGNNTMKMQLELTFQMYFRWHQSSNW